MRLYTETYTRVKDLYRGDLTIRRDAFLWYAVVSYSAGVRIQEHQGRWRHICWYQPLRYSDVVDIALPSFFRQKILGAANASPYKSLPIYTSLRQRTVTAGSVVASKLFALSFEHITTKNGAARMITSIIVYAETCTQYDKKLCCESVSFGSVLLAAHV